MTNRPPDRATPGIEGERKLVTVLFADVAGSTALAERLDPEDWAGIMNGAFAFMNAAVARYDGTVSRLMGDAVLALFGAPRTHEDDAERAVRAALEMRDAAGDYAARLRAEYDIDFGLRVGINTGTVVLGMLGDETRAEYTAMGDATNVAARLQSVARRGSVLIGADTWRLVRHAFDVEPRGSAELKGRTGAIETYEVVAARPAADHARGVEGLRSPLVGRRAELERLRALTAALHHGAGAAVAIVGEAGLGKSRLVAELRDETAGSLPWLECRGVSYGQAVAYHPWKQLGHAFIGADAADTAATVRAKLHAFCRRAGVPDDDVPFLETMLDVETPSSRAALENRGDEDVSRPMAAAVMRTIRSSIHADGAPVPHVLVFDDLHWADGASIDLLAGIATLAGSEPLLLICGLRPDRAAASWRLQDRLNAALGARYVGMQLEPLGREHARELLANLLAVKDMPDAVRARILERSDGNPFFLEEVIRSLIDSGHLVRDNGRWRATSEIADVAIPDTLAGVLAARIDRLPDETRRVAQAAAVLGRIFQQRALATVCRRSPGPDRVDDVEPHLGTLRYEELVRERAKQPEREYIFKHAMTQETAYGLLLRRRRRELHRLAGDALEELFPDRLDEMAPVLAWHYDHGGDAQRTAVYAARAADAAARLHALAEASDHYERAYDALQRVPEPSPEKLLDVVLDWTVVQYRLRRYDGAIERLLEAEKLAREHGDRYRLAQVLSWIALIHMLTGFPTRAEAYLIESNELALELGEDRLLLLPLFFATDGMIDRDPRAAIERMGEVVDLARRHRMPEIEGHALASTAVAYARIGDFEMADEYSRRALAAAPSGGHRVKEADVHLLVGLAQLEMGRTEEGLSYLRRGTDLARAENALECVCAGEYGLGIAALESQRAEQALSQFEAALDVAGRAGWRELGGFINRIRAGLAAARLEGGAPGALQDLELALTNSRRSEDEYQTAVTAEQLARTYMEQNDAARAVTLLDEALAYYRRAGMVRYEARAADLRARAAESSRAAGAAQPPLIP